MDKKYISPSSQIECSAAQLIAEIMTAREFKNQKLPSKFWNREPWKRVYVKHIVQANAILKLYDEAAVIRAIRHKDGSWQRSLRQISLVEIIEREQKVLDEQVCKARATQVEKVKPIEEIQSRPNPSVGKTKFSKLK